MHTLIKVPAVVGTVITVVLVVATALADSHTELTWLAPTASGCVTVIQFLAGLVTVDKDKITAKLKRKKA